MFFVIFLNLENTENMGKCCLTSDTPLEKNSNSSLLGEIYVDSTKTHMFLFVSFHKIFYSNFFLDIIFNFTVFFEGIAIVYFRGDRDKLRMWLMGFHWFHRRNRGLQWYEFLYQSQFRLHSRINSLWYRTTTNNWSATSHLVDAIVIVIVMPSAAEPKPNDDLSNHPQLAFDTTQLPIMSTNECPKGLHSTLFVVRVVACIFVVCHQTRIVKALIPIDIAKAIDVKEKLCSQCTKINTR